MTYDEIIEKFKEIEDREPTILHSLGAIKEFEKQIRDYKKEITTSEENRLEKKRKIKQNEDKIKHVNESINGYNDLIENFFSELDEHTHVVEYPLSPDSTSRLIFDREKTEITCENTNLVTKVYKKIPL